MATQLDFMRPSGNKQTASQQKHHRDVLREAQLLFYF
jgi:hypothetical protein